MAKKNTQKRRGRKSSKKKISLFSGIFANKKLKKKSKKLLLRIFLWLSLAVFLYLSFCVLTLPNLEKAIYRDRTPAASILSSTGNEVHTFGTVYSDVVYLENLPDYAAKAIIATEDRRFYSHFGLDFISFGRAMLRNLTAGRYAQGGSTITQQLAKNLFLSSNKNITRKIQELIMAFWLEYKFSKEQILTLYLNRVYLGSGTYGIEAASQKYFQKPASDMNLREASIIAGMLKGPSRYNPIANRERSLERANLVLKNMLDNGYIAEDDFIMAKRMPIGQEKTYKVKGARHFADWAYATANEHLGERDNDIYVLTTLDQKIQMEAEQILVEAINANKNKNVTEGTVVVMDYNGAVLAMTGGINYDKSQFNRATQALRQPGSSFKPIVFLTALEQGWRVMDKIDDLPIIIDKWKPENYDKKHYGRVTLMHALTKSLNLATIDLANKVGGNKIIANAKKMGITTKITNSPSMALGTFEVKVIDMAAAYTVIANGGREVSPYTIQEIYTKDGYQLYMREYSRPKYIVDKKAVKELKEMLVNVIDNGTGKKSKNS